MKTDELTLALNCDEPTSEEDREQLFQILDEHWEPTGRAVIYIDEIPHDFEEQWEEDNLIYSPDDK